MIAPSGSKTNNLTSMKISQIAKVILLLAAAAQVVRADYFTNAGSMNIARYHHCSVTLRNGQVLVTGGNLSSSELYTPDTGIWSATGTLNIGRNGFTLNLLQNGKVLAVGDVGESGYLISAEIYDPSTETWLATGHLNIPRFNHTATLLPNGKVLVAGGFNNGILSRAELYDPNTGTWTETGPLNVSRHYHTATLLTNGMVLVAGGSDGTGGVSASAELYDPATGTWSPTRSLNAARYDHTATLLFNGQVLVAGNDIVNGKITELYDPTTGTWLNVGLMGTARYSPTATLLPNGKVLVTGSQVFAIAPSLSSAELFDPFNGTWTNTSSMSYGRAFHTANLLTNGNVLIAGGYSYPNELPNAELYYSTNGSTATLITSQPVPLTVTNGHFASFAVAAFGFPSLSYQWFLNGTKIKNATETTHTIQNSFPSNAGFYTVVVTGNYGSITSNPALLTVLPLGITAPTMRANGQFQFGFDTATGVNYSVECSTNLTQWFPIMTLGGVGLPVSVIDPNAVSSRQRFYRVGLSAQ